MTIASIARLTICASSEKRRSYDYSFCYQRRSSVGSLAGFVGCGVGFGAGTGRGSYERSSLLSPEVGRLLATGGSSPSVGVFFLRLRVRLRFGGADGSLGVVVAGTVVGRPPVNAVEAMAVERAPDWVD